MAYSPLSKNWKRHCSGCGDLIKEGHPNIHIEKRYEEETDLLSTFAKVWHQDCWDKHLDDGESLE